MFLIDEIDKMGSDFRGDPSSAMLEVLDPEQHSTFRDHYLDLPFDLSKVLFICTANQLDTIPGPLLDRMDVIQLSGYTEEEKVGIARKYLVPKQIEAHGLDARARRRSPRRPLRLVIREYTREAGVRGLERQIARALPQGGAPVAEGKAKRVRIDEKKVRELARPAAVLGRGAQADVRPGRRDRARGARPSAATSSSSRRPAYPGKGTLKVTGQLGDVMQESAQAAHSWVRVARRRRSASTPKWFERQRRPRPRPGRRGAEGRAVRRRHDGDGARLARARPGRSPTTSR